MHICHSFSVFLSFTSSSSLYCQPFFLSLFPSLIFFPFIHQKKSWNPGWKGGQGCTFQLEIRAQKHRRFKWMPADRRTGDRHNAAIFPPLFSAAISTYRPPLLSAVDYRTFLIKCKKANKQLITVTCGLRKIPSLSSRLWSHCLYDNLPHVQKHPLLFFFLPTSNVSLLLPLNCSVNFQKSVKSHSSTCSDLTGSKVTSIQATCLVNHCWWSENTNRGFKSNQFIIIILTRLH